jgi:CO dehydrogenase maturation factor
MKLVVAGKGGVGKTTVAGTLARLLARDGEDVLALDADANPMLGVSLGVGMERTELLVGVRQGLDAGEVEHQPTVEGMVETFGTEAPGGVRLVVASRIDRIDPGCP